MPKPKSEDFWKSLRKYTVYAGKHFSGRVFTFKLLVELDDFKPIALEFFSEPRAHPRGCDSRAPVRFSAHLLWIRSFNNSIITDYPIISYCSLLITLTRAQSRKQRARDHLVRLTYCGVFTAVTSRVWRLHFVYCIRPRLRYDFKYNNCSFPSDPRILITDESF